MLASLVVAAMLAMSNVCATPRDNVREAFSKFISAQNAHDLKVVDESLFVSPDFLWIAPGQVVRGRDAALIRFGELFQGAWRVDPDWSTFQVVMLDVSTAEVFVRVKITTGASPQSARLNQILVNTPRGWRVLTIVVGVNPTNWCRGQRLPSRCFNRAIAHKWPLSATSL
jgi:hypothetical protein